MHRKRENVDFRHPGNVDFLSMGYVAANYVNRWYALFAGADRGDYAPVIANFNHFAITACVFR